MFTSHCREVIDDHMNDSNWKKLIDLGGFPLTGSTGTLHQSSQIMQSMPYLNTTRRRFLGLCLAWQHLIK